ncbi:energy transducer TonB [Colwellia psychrerythraea]|uniref:TonB family protein n=1 Tax=Colwellia psychrerythraea TaxID=28229 RepID=A0A099KNB7_COLPS|nr:energy transducer TonB [Colwellia psychrerythraea]KGJ92259.1 TonB family protein [Colwellia psychrerythraea]
MFHKLFVATLSISVAFGVNSNVNAADISQHLSTIIVPEPIKRVSPKYPVSAARQSREGWTVLSFVIDEKGEVSNVLVKESSGSADFDKASLKAVSQWKYQPAFENGKPIQQCINDIQMNFKMGNKNGVKGVTRRFHRKYNIATQAIKDKDYKIVEEQLAQMKKVKYMHLIENNYMHILAANYAKEIGDTVTELYHLNRVYLDTGASSEQLAFSVLSQRFYLEVTLNQFQNAFSTYEELIKLDAAQPHQEKYEKIIADVNVLISSNQDIVINGEIKADYWFENLVRNEFSLTDVEGSLHTLDVRCANKRHVYTVEKDNTWKLPSSWENCSIYVYGEPKTSFKLIEHPLKS